MLTPHKLRCEYLDKPIGLDVRQPRLSWQLQAQYRGASQSAYQIRVASNSAMLERAPSWDTGQIHSDQSQQIAYSGPALKAQQRYYWQVRVWDEQNRSSDWSEIAYWETGLLGQAWQADWISPDWDEDPNLPQPAPQLRRSFGITQPISRARIYATSLGLYELWLNGQRVGDALLTPGWTSYDHRIQYQSYDVTDLLQQGENVLGALLGDGWYRGYLGNKGFHNLYGDQLALLAQLHISYANGQTEIIASDTHWRSTQSPIQLADLYLGETYDARLEKRGWQQSGYDDSDWYGVRILNARKDIVTAQVGPLVRRQEQLAPIAIHQSPKGETILDFGVNLVGWVRMYVRGPSGSIITLRHAEILDQQGNLYTENLRAADQITQYVLRGDANGETYEPRFSFQGFRYVAVEGLSGPVRSEDFTAIVIHSDMPLISSFECSNPLINQLQQNIIWGQKGNFVDLPTDCPQRDERLGWTGDTQVFARTACFNMNIAGFLSKWLYDLRADQLPDGSVPYIVPDVMSKFRVLEHSNASASGAAGWADAAIIVPWTLYLCYGDTRILAEQYESMSAWVNYMHQQADSDLIWRSGSQFGDWLDYRGPDPRRPAPVTNTELVATAFFAYSSQLLAQIAKILNKPIDAEHYQQLAQQVKSAFCNEFVSPAGRIGPNTQSAYVFALHFDLLPEDLRPQAALRLAQAIEKHNYHLSTGFLGTPYLCHVLSKHGYLDLAFRLLTQESYPSWLYPVTKGATTIWERWDGIKPDGSFQDASMNSFNHYAYGAIGEWLYHTVAGIEADPQQPGYKHIIIQPHFGGNLQYVKASFESPYGLIESHWQLMDDSYRLSVRIPPNTTATIYLDTPSADLVSEGNTELSLVTGIKHIQNHNNIMLISIGSGDYDFIVQHIPNSIQNGILLPQSLSR